MPVLKTSCCSTGLGRWPKNFSRSRLYSANTVLVKIYNLCSIFVFDDVLWFNLVDEDNSTFHKRPRYFNKNFRFKGKSQFDRCRCAWFSDGIKVVRTEFVISLMFNSFWQWYIFGWCMIAVVQDVINIRRFF